MPAKAAATGKAPTPSHFFPREFACKCGSTKCAATGKTIVPDLLEMLEILRARLGRPMVITSGVRCPAWNEASGGRPGSAHLTGEAVDISAVTDAERGSLIEEAFRIGFRRVGVGRTFVHLDVSKSLAKPRVWLYDSGRNTAAGGQKGGLA